MTCKSKPNAKPIDYSIALRNVSENCHSKDHNQTMDVSQLCSKKTLHERWLLFRVGDAVVATGK